jgi:hypothetical protein
MYLFFNDAVSTFNQDTFQRKRILLDSDNKIYLFNLKVVKIKVFSF